MFEFFNSLFRSKNKKNIQDNTAEKESADKRKCKKCLRRVNFDSGRCPICGCTEFYDD